MPRRKEPAFFGEDLRRLRWQRPSFNEYMFLFRKGAMFPCVGEASTMYLVSKSAAAEIKRFSPDSRIIIMIRDPVQAMHSMHGQLLSSFSEDIHDFELALRAEKDRSLGKCLPKHCGYREQCMYKYQYHYTEQIQRYIDQFKRERVYVVIYDEFKANTNKVYNDILSFLGVSPFTLSDYSKINVSKRRRFRWLYRSINYLPSLYRRIDPGVRLARVYICREMIRVARNIETAINVVPYQRPPLAVEIERQLRVEFAPEVEQLSKLLGCDLSQWLLMPNER